MNSCIYMGRVRHRRFLPVEHAFRYRLYMMYVDLEELPTLFDRYRLWSAERRNLASFFRKDHYGPPGESLETSIRSLVGKHTGRQPEGPIRLLTHFRYAGYIFNPVSFYYCYSADGDTLETIVAEVHNTPWKERYCYVLDRTKNVASGDRWRFRFPKAFHVSPFMEMNQEYDWRFGVPGKNLTVHMENHQEGHRVFDATMNLERVEISSASLRRVLLNHPAMTATVIGAIHFQALKLWLKGAPVHDHPGKADSGR